MEGRDIDVGDIRISKDSLFLMKEMADPSKVDFTQKEREDVENAPSLIRDQLKKSAHASRHRRERQRQHDREKERQHERKDRDGQKDRRDRDSGRDERRSHRHEASRRGEEDRHRSSSRPSSIQPPLETIPERKSSSSRPDGPLPVADVIRARSRVGHEDSMMARAMEDARKRSRSGDAAAAAPPPSLARDDAPLVPGFLKVSKTPPSTSDIPLPAALMPTAKQSEFRVTSGGMAPDSSGGLGPRPDLKSSVLDRKMSEARERDRSRSMSRYRSREDDYRRRFRQLERSGYEGSSSRPGGSSSWRDDYRPSGSSSRRYRSRERDRYGGGGSSYRRSRDSRAEEIEKKDYLMAMEKMKMQGITLTKQYTMDDSLVDIQYEFERHNLNLESIQKVETSKSYIRILAVVIVVVNHFTGRHLKLVGWTERLSRDLDNPKYFMALEEMCRSMHRRGPPSPWIQLAIMFVSSIFVTHVNNQWGLGIGGGNQGSGGNGGGSAAQPKDSGGGLGGLLGSLGGINLGSVLGTVGNMFGAGGGAGPRPVPVTPHQPAAPAPPAPSASSNPSNPSGGSTSSRRGFRKPLVRP